MDTELQNLDLIDALSERHIQLRNLIEKQWNATGDIHISNSEWFIMARVYKNRRTISYVSKQVNISRQATHKFIKNMEAKGLVEVHSVENNKKQKCIQLTDLGEKYYEENVRLKANIEKQIAERIGPEKMEVLKEILKADWNL